MVEIDFLKAEKKWCSDFMCISIFYQDMQPLIIISNFNTWGVDNF